MWQQKFSACQENHADEMTAYGGLVNYLAPALTLFATWNAALTPFCAPLLSLFTVGAWVWLWVWVWVWVWVWAWA